MRLSQSVALVPHLTKAGCGISLFFRRGVSMARLPQPGADAGTWGSLLNSFLLTEHDVSGHHDIASLLHMPAGTGQILTSAPLTSQKVQWQSISQLTHGLPVGGATAQILAKQSGADYDAAWATLNKQDVGLGSVDNTSDIAKPVSTAQQQALNQKADTSLVIALGVAL